MCARLLQYDRTPLHMAARWGHLDVVHLLVEHAANFELRCDVSDSIQVRARCDGQKHFSQPPLHLRSRASRHFIMPLRRVTSI